MRPQRTRLTHALLLSLLIHALLLSLIFDGSGTGLPGFGFPWQERRIEVPDLFLALAPAQGPGAEPAVTPIAVPLMKAWIKQHDAGGSAMTPSMPPAPTQGRTAAAIAPEANRRTDTATGAAPAQTPLRAHRPGDMAPPPIPEPAVIALARSDEAKWVESAVPPMPAPDIAAAAGASDLESATAPVRDAGDAAPVRIDQESRERAVELAKLETSGEEGQRQAEQLEAARLDAARQGAARVEAARLEAERKDATRQEAARLESERQLAALREAARLKAERQGAAQQEAIQQKAAQQEAARLEVERQQALRQEAARQGATRQEAARQEAARQEAARQEAARQEAARQEAAQQEAARQEAARQEAARQEAVRQEAARQEAARQEAARQEAARQEAVRQEAVRQEAVRQEAAEKREAVLRAIGRQLDEEAARREAATAAERLAPSSSGARRYWLLGRTDPNPELILYAEAWSRKIQLNATTFDMVREVATRPHKDPLVTVAIRSDGSVESVTFVLSSGVAAIDEAVRRIVDSQKPYRAFPPGLAREYDVILIRRSWHFDTAIRLQ